MSLKASLSKRNKRWAITNKMFFSLFMTGTIIEFSLVGAAFIDGLVISRFLGPDAMAASGIAAPIFSILGIISGLLAVGMQVQCAQEIGRGNLGDFSRYVSATLFVGAIASVAVTGLFLLLAVPMTVMFGATGNAAELLEPASRYLTGVVIGAPALIMTAILTPALQLDSGRKTIQTGAVIGTVVNIGMDLISVKMGWGIFGIGLATAVGSYMNLFYQFTFFCKKDRKLRLCKPDVPAKEFLRMLKNGTDRAVKRLANTIRPIILNIVIISYGGAVAMSAFSIQNSFSNIIGVFGMGFSSAVALLTGVYYGEINEEGIEVVNQYEHKLIAYIYGAICTLEFLFARQIVSLYASEDSEMFSMAVFAIRMNAIQTPLWALVESRIKYLQAIHRMRNMNLLIFAESLVFVLLAAITLGKLFGSYGILASYAVGDILSLISIYIFYAIKIRSRPVRKDFLNLPEYFHLNPGDVISLDIYDREEVSLASEQIMMFCKGHKINNKMAYFASLAFEELASNIVMYGFPASKDSVPMIDIRVVINGNDLILRLRDNCPEYDVTRQIAALNEADSDPSHNIGTRIVSRIATDITYLNTVDTNTLIIHLKLDTK